MIKKKLAALCIALAACFVSSVPAYANTTTVMENSGAYLFEWRPVDYGNGTSFAILVGGNEIYEKKKENMDSLADVPLTLCRVFASCKL